MRYNFFTSLSTKLSIKEKALFAKRLSFLVKAGVPILESLKIIQKNSPSKAKSKILDQVIADVSNGQFLSSSLAKFEHIFDKFAVNIIRIGEESGTLDENLNYLAEELKKKQMLRKKLWGALLYPIFIIIATFGIAGLLTIYVFPKILPIFQSLHVALPLATRILIFVNNFLTKYWVILGLAIVGLVIGAALALKNNSAKLTADRSILRIPLLGDLIRNYHLANFCRTLGLLLKSDVKIVKAFSIAAETTSNEAYKRELEKISKGIVGGGKMTDYMQKNHRLFPHILTQMISVGETTGRLDDTLLYLSELYENEVDELTKNLSTVLEPALMLFMGVIVGFIAVSIITPIYAITQNLHP